MEILDPSLLIRLAATAGIVLAATLIAERAGAFFGAMIAALPISAGPAYLFIAMDHDATFVAQSALTSLGVNVMITPFLLICSALLRRAGIIASLGIALTIWALGSSLILQASMTITAAFALNVVVYSVCLYLSRHYLTEGAPPAMRRGPLDVVLRVVAVVGVVAAAIIGGRLLGAEVAGLAAIVPIVWISMTVVLYARIGGLACSAVVANGIAAMLGFCLALTAIYVTIDRLGATVALSLALVLCVGWNAALTLTRPYNPMYSRAGRLGGQ